ncbi:SDR family NAD(P)-dependent oxidoreductase [Aliikangiella coralliicola]|uniref:SDR family NAD(P)-dependent oxidoreductase n=1 Tax=Aliikangiella coralliicola TaxID=2592383 RepID=A0A545U958_9GAMM|nr:SDR family NAD(P)-dependent oxidoreductase [Aliikangiella coralliicola]TQV86001.1 SDR family NAD(P)-dependent oxidoreductase [Aliikangiella coralliicola]
MIDFIEYVVSELKSKRLSKNNALALVKQFSLNSNASAKASAIHPLLQINTSDLSQQSYGSTFTGDEFFLADHQVSMRSGQQSEATANSVLPGVAYLEMARVAIEQAMPEQSESTILELRNIVWLQPIVVAEPKDVAIALFVDEADGSESSPGSYDEQLEYEVYSSASEDSDQELIHCQGQAAYVNLGSPQKLNIEQLKNEMQRGQLDADSIYTAYNNMGLNYGAAHQGVSAIYQGENQLLAKLHLPTSVESTQNEYILHPSVMDSALQSTLGLVDDINQIPDQPSLPFALGAIRIFSPCTSQMFAWVRYSEGAKPDDRITKLDIDLCDEQGQVCIQIREFTSRVLNTDIPNETNIASTASNGILLATPQWKASQIDAANQPKAAAQTSIEQQTVMVCGLADVQVGRLEKQLDKMGVKNRCVSLKTSQQHNIAEDYHTVALACFEQVKEQLKQKKKGTTLIQIVIANDPTLTLCTGLTGLLKTASQENPHLVGQIILTDSTLSEVELAGRLTDESARIEDSVIKYEDNKRYVLNWDELDQSSSQNSQPTITFKDNGAYLITGGLGGLGILFAEEILRQTTRAKIIFTGRSALTSSKQSLLNALIERVDNGASIDQLTYQQLDISDLKKTQQCVSDIVSDLQQSEQQLSGIIHCAGMIIDNFILKKESEEFSQVLKPKVSGTYNLDLACKDIDLDFMVLFSSGVAALGNVGQADYATANGFMDQFAAYRNQQVKNNQRRGQTLSINWPFWEEGGMQLDETTRAMLLQSSGVVPMRTDSGIKAFYRSLNLRYSQTLVMEGDLARIRQIFSAEASQNAASKVSLTEKVQSSTKDESAVKTPNAVTIASQQSQTSASGQQTVDLSEQTQSYLRKELSTLLKLPSHKIDPKAPLENYGIDSILAMNLTSQLEKTFGSLSKTLFFEYQTISELTTYFVESHTEQLATLFDVAENENNELDSQQPMVDASASSSETKTVSNQKRLAGKSRVSRRFRRSSHSDNSTAGFSGELQTVNDEPIAIIGLSGRYPESPDVDTYWQNLRDGKDCIVEIPKQRWDWREYYSEDPKTKGLHSSKWGGFIEGVEEFDPIFFNISPREAEYIDPQERLFLQHAWIAVEDAGYTRASLQMPHGNAASTDTTGQVGVYVGVMYGEYNLSGSLASIANRVSYVLNLHGPSITLDTMCSSSLTAIHLACQDLKQGRTDLAIAGGVNVCIHPNKYEMLSAGQFISSDGHCQSFGEGGDGYIPGEGVGSVILKRLSEAKRDRHNIYGVIKGSALNHGGKTNGYTVPNPQAQANAISRALIESKTDPRHISYIEAHGTGTKLGDPIEIAALSKAFNENIRGIDSKQSSAQNSSQTKQFCLLGSAKSNVGHCESAAGIAGITKILLQMKHRKIVPSLHSTRLNPNIHFENTPFIVNQTLKDWEQPVIDGRKLPRIAGISSFGAGGSNAHIIVEEYDAADKIDAESTSNLQVIVPLSARTVDQLKQKACDLLDFIEQQAERSTQSLNLSAMAYTLQVGRESMEERLGFMANSIDQLAEKLSAYVGGDQEIEDVYQGQVKSNKETLSLFTADADFEETIGKWIARKKLPKLLDLWSKGFELDWHKLYGENKPSRISLPTYPFAKDKYWIDPIVGQYAPKTGLALPSDLPESGSRKMVSTALHPLLHTNTSDLDQQRYDTVFRGDENYLQAFQSELKFLPSLVSLEMARAAIEYATPSRPESSILELHDVVWGQPLFARGTATSISLTTNDNGDTEFDIYTPEQVDLPGHASQPEVVHCQGRAIFVQQPAPARLDVSELKSQMASIQLESLLAEGIFAEGMLAEKGVVSQAITGFYRGQNHRLAEVRMPGIDKQPSSKPLSDFIVNPELMDAVVQTAMDLVGFRHSSSLLFELDSMQIVFGCTDEMHIWVRHSKTSDSSEKIALDVDLCDLQGNVCVQMKGLSLRSVSLQSAPLQSVPLQQPKIDSAPSTINLATPSSSFTAVSETMAKPNSVQLASSLAVTEAITGDHSVSKSLSPQPLVSLKEVGLVEAGQAKSRQQTAESIITQPPADVAVNPPAANRLVSQQTSSIEGLSKESRSKEGLSNERLSKETLQQQLQVSLAEALYMDINEIDVEKSFVDLGLDSIVGVEWVNAINKQYGLTISATRVYDYSNVKELASFLENELEKSAAPLPDDSSTQNLTVEDASSAPAKSLKQTSPIASVTAISEQSETQSQTEDSVPTISTEQLQLELKDSLADALYMNISEIDTDKSFVDLGLDSIVGVEWVKAINKQYGLEISATRVYDYSNIQELASFLAKELEKKPASAIKSIVASAATQSVSTNSAVSTNSEAAAAIAEKAETTTPVVSPGQVPLIDAYPVLTRRSRGSRSVSAHSAVSTLSSGKQGKVQNEQINNEKVAIIGMSGRYPQAQNLQEYWDNLLQGKNAITEIPSSRWDVDQYYDPDPTKQGKVYCKWLGALDDVDCFDPLFFQISPSEAESMDPQHRLFMQEGYRAFEDAGYANNSLSNQKCGVYLGIMSSEYSFLLSNTNVETTGNSFAIGAARIAYYLNLKGPAIPIDTACSSSLVAIHLGSQALLNHEIDMALAGGVSLYLLPESYLGMCRAGMLSPEGQCKTFDNSANGFVPGEGAGAVVLKRLEDAQADNDFIYGVILGSGINQDGKTNGITAPSVNSQIELERDLYDRHDINPETISYIETHGTGTKLGDPIELEALATVFKEKTTNKNYCALGAVKSNIGHTSGAAGVASVQKVLLSMKHKTLVPSLNVNKENSLFDFDSSPFYISREKQDWEVKPGTLRRAGVSSFGFSGTNAHLVIEEYAPPISTNQANIEALDASEVIIPLSARTEKQLQQKARDLLAFITSSNESEQPLSLRSMAYTLQVGRSAMKERLGFVVNSIEQLTEKLQQVVSGSHTERSVNGVFQGQVTRDKETLSLFTADADLRETIDKWISQKKLSKLADLWVKGLELDWNKLYSENREQPSKPKRVSLPTYPFAKERYWVESSAVDAPSPSTPRSLSQQGETVSANKNASREQADNVLQLVEKKQKVLFSPSWNKQPLNVAEEQQTLTGSILILAETDELFSKMKKQLKAENRFKFSDDIQQKDAIVWVKPGEAYQKTSRNTFVVNPLQEKDFEQLVGTLQNTSRLPSYIIHHGFTDDIFTDNTVSKNILNDNIAKGLNAGIYSLFNLSKSLIKQKHQTSVQFLSVFATSSTGAPLNTALGGFYKTLTLENPKYLGKVLELQHMMLDLASEKAGAIHNEQLDLIFNELTDKNWRTAEVRYQQLEEKSRYDRYVKNFESYPLTEASAETKIAALPLKQNGVYIITGGLGGLGFIFSKYLAKNFQARLVLVGRSALKNAQEEKINQLKSHGAEILYIQADVFSQEDMDSVVSRAKARFSNINGVIHSAGVNRDSFILKKTNQEIDAVITPKVYGTINLDRATQNEPLDCFVLFSSVAGALGNAGQCDYAYANHFLDAFAQTRESLRSTHARFGKTLSINWPLWLEGGMTIGQNEIALNESQAGMSPLPTEAGIQYWEELLSLDLTQGLALYGTPSKISAYVAQQSAAGGGAERIAVDTIGAESGLDRAVDLAMLEEKTQAYLKGLIGEEIKLSPEQIDPLESFDVYGIDSIIIGRLNAKLEQHLGELPKTLFYQYETVEEFTQYLTQESQQALILHFALSDSADKATSESASETSQSQIDSQAADNQAANELQSANLQTSIQPASPISQPESIAIIGVHGYYPQSENLDDYWENLKQGKDLVELVPANRWDFEEFFDADPDKAAEGKIYCKWGSFLNDFDKFDPSFFNLTTQEAKIIDPQERLFLQSVWATIEDAGYTVDSLKKRYPKAKSADVGVFAGVTTNSYHLLTPEEWSRGNMVSPSALPWSIANRVSYFFDFQGPSMPVDTACSSSLVALHLACESLNRQECQVAVAGGVNLYLHPSKYQSFCSRRMVSQQGKNCSFGAGDDGFVPGEGVGTLLLKPLSKAKADGDHIYGVIAASAYDHSGRSNGYSAPNPNSQASLIENTLRKAQIHPESISYVEGHGTGTQLGDSLEIVSLTQAFQKQTTKKNYCPVGSVKANIGHSESAAGVAGVAKILLQMKHQQLVPSIHCEEINPNIDFDDSPFHLQRDLTHWEASPNHPRRAMINSFGAGGVNACVILEEHCDAVESVTQNKAGEGNNASEVSAAKENSAVAEVVNNQSHLFILSAKNADALREYADRLLDYINKTESVDLANLCYTLQIGRQPMAERLAIVVSEVKELVSQLSGWRQRKPVANIYRGSLDPRQGKKRLAKGKEEALLQEMFESQNLTALADKWTQGEVIDWERLYTNAELSEISASELSGKTPIRIALPTYPFAKERCWISDDLIPEKRLTVKSEVSQLHPLVSYNSSTLKQVSFSSALSDDEFYALEHRVNGEKIFPGAGFMEMACIAGNIAGEQRVAKIKDIVWIHPLSFSNGPQLVQTFMKTIGNSTEYEITSLDEENERIVHSEGRLFFEADLQADSIVDNQKETTFSIQQLKSQCSAPQNGNLYYENFKSFGFDYGPAFQAIEAFYVNDNFALSQLKIADYLKADFDQYILHPCIIDSALQTVVGLIGRLESGTPYLPFALDEVEIIRPITHNCYAYVESADTEGHQQGDFKKFNIQLLNERGEVLVRMKDFYVRALTKEPDQSGGVDNFELVES